MASKTNPHEYNDEMFLKRIPALEDAVWALWAVGLSEDDIRAEVDNALENAE